jgi:hypothetical protein
MPAQDLATLFKIEPSAQLADVAQLGPAPRTIDANMDAYVGRAINSLAFMWLMFAILFGAGDVIAWMNGVHYPPMLLLLFGGLTFWSFRWRSRERERVRETLRRGTLIRAEIRAMYAIEKRGRYGQVLYVDYYVTFVTPKGPVVLKTRDPGVSLLQVGISEEIVWYESQPDVVVPTMLLV